MTISTIAKKRGISTRINRKVSELTEFSSNDCEFIYYESFFSIKLTKVGSKREIPYASIKNIHLYDILDEETLERKRSFTVFKIGLVILPIIWGLALLYTYHIGTFNMDAIWVMGIFSGLATFTINTYVTTKNKKILAWIDKHLEGLKYSYGIELQRDSQESLNITFKTKEDQSSFVESLKLRLEKD